MVGSGRAGGEIAAKRKDGRISSLSSVLLSSDVFLLRSDR